MKKRKSKVSLNDWIERCNKKHNFKYDYSKSHFNHLTDIVTIICKKHGEFKRRADLHLRSGCIRCAKNKKYHIDDVKELLNRNTTFKILPFDNYTKNTQKIQVECKKSGHLTTKAINHLLSNKANCSICSKSHRYTKEEWLVICKEIHDDKYDYSLSDYKNGYSRVIIICPTHGKFQQIAFSHKNGSGCKKCNKSLGENIISEILSSKNIKYFEQKTFDGLKYKSNLYFDFYLPDYNLCIEFDGMQHKKSYYFFGGENALKERVLRDEIKNNYCKSNNINLLRLNFQINYLTKQRISKKIEEKINETLNDCKI